MDKNNLKKMALLGMAGGMLLASQAPLAADQNSGSYLAAGCGGKSGCSGYKGGKDNLPGYFTQKPTQHSCGNQRSGCGNQKGYTADSQDDMMQDSSDNSNTNGKMMTESDLMSKLNSDSKALYQSLSPEGKALALKLANQDCKGKNDCKGLNSCKSDDHSCAGKGSCRGTSTGAFKDKNVAVKIAAQKMAEKRNGAVSSSNRY